MKFIFPQNYNFKSKLFGFIDYSTAILNIIWNVFMYCLVNLLFNTIYLKIAIYIICCLPLLIISIIGFSRENIIYVICYIFKFIKNRKIYFFN